MNKELKKSLLEHKAVIWGLLNREITTKFGDSYFGYTWLFIEPLIYIFVLYSMYTILGHSTGDMPLLLFLLTGIVPFFFFRKAVQSSTGAIRANQALLSYRQVKVIDTIMTRLLLESILSFSSAIICTLIILYFGQGSTVYYPLRIVFTVLLLACFTSGISLMVAIVSYYYIDLNKFLAIINRVLFFTSGVFFSLDKFPPQVAYYLSFNPILQIIEFIRSAFSIKHYSIFLSYEYLMICTIITLFLGLGSYFVARKNILTNSRSR